MDPTELILVRSKLKEIEQVIDNLKAEHHLLVNDYIELDLENYIYVTDHAIVRYLERCKGLILTGDTDTDKLYTRVSNLPALRKKILSPSTQKYILRNKLKHFIKDEFIYVIKNLSLVTILYKDEELDNDY